jgi:hypothetical protein
MSTASTVFNISTMAAWTSLATMFGVIAMAAITGKPLLAPAQSISHILFGERVLRVFPVNFMYVLIGFALNTFAMIGWCALAELIFQLVSGSPGNLWISVVVGASISTLAYFVDFRVVPKRFTPGFEHVLSRRSLYLVYWGLAVALCLGSLGRVA